LLTLLDDFHLQQLVDDPTRYSHSSSNILDLVAVSHPALISNLSVEREFCDHCYISFCFSKHLCDYSDVTRSRKVYLYGKSNFDAIRSDMHDFQSKFFSSTPKSRTVNDNWLSFKDALSSSITKHVPTKLVKSSDKWPVWLTCSVCRSIKHRDAAAKLAKKSDLLKDRDKYRKL